MADLLIPAALFLTAAVVVFGLQQRQVRQRVTSLLEQIASIPLVIGGAYFLHLMMTHYWTDYTTVYSPALSLVVGAATGWIIGATVTAMGKRRSRQ